MKLQELLDGYSQSVVWSGNARGYAILAEICERRPIATLSEELLPPVVPGQRLTLIVVPDAVLYAPP